MQINEDNSTGSPQIRSYQPGCIVVDSQVYTQSIIITPTRIITDWVPQCLDDCQPEHFAIIADMQPKVMLLGTGDQLIFPPQALLAELYNRQIGVEVMNTSAACRTFNVLTAEDRNVVAALIL